MGGKSYSGSSMRAGSYPSEYVDAGHVVLTKEVTLQADGKANDDASIVIPANAEIIDIIFDTTTAHTAATFTVTAGITAGGSEYASATDVKAAGRVRPTFTGAQLSAMNDIGAESTVYFRSAAGTPTTVGTTLCQLVYRMRADGE